MLYINYEEYSKHLGLQFIRLNDSIIALFDCKEVRVVFFGTTREYNLCILNTEDKIKNISLKKSDTFTDKVLLCYNADGVTIVITSFNNNDIQIFNIFEPGDRIGLSEEVAELFTSIAKKNEKPVHIYKYISTDGLHEDDEDMFDLNNLPDSELSSANVLSLDVVFDVWYEISEELKSEINKVTNKYKVEYKTPGETICNNVSMSDYLRLKELLRNKVGGDQYFGIYIGYDSIEYIK